MKASRRAHHKHPRAEQQKFAPRRCRRGGRPGWRATLASLANARNSDSRAHRNRNVRIGCFGFGFSVREADGSIKPGGVSPRIRQEEFPSLRSERQRYRTASSSERDKGATYAMKGARKLNLYSAP